MTTVSMTRTHHRSYVHDGRTYIDQPTFDRAMSAWIELVGHDDTDVASIHDGSSDVTYAYAWRNDKGVVQVVIIEFEEEAGGYAIDSLPFFLDIQYAEPVPDAPKLQSFTVELATRPGETLFPGDIRQALETSGITPLTVR